MLRLEERTDVTTPAGEGRAERVQAALYRIAELASSARDMQEFYREVHAVVGELMYANNFFIALYDDERQLISFPYYVDEIDLDIPDPSRWDAFGEGEAKGTTAYVLRTGEPQLLTHERTLELIEQGEIVLTGFATEEQTWLGVPLKADGRVIGVAAVQSYTRDVRYTDEDKELLTFVGQHIGAALSRARAIEETRQRNAELALINSVQEALAGELELQAIYDVVGDKIQEVFDAQVVDIGMYDPSSGLISFPYTIERGVRFPDEPIPLMGFRKHVIETRESLLIDENLIGAAERYGNPLLAGEMPKSVLYVPLVAEGRATGVISLQNIDREHAFSESDRQLLDTLARSLSVALENARLVHETRQRNAELALINSVQAALAGELEMQAIYDVVGDKIQEIFDAQVVDIGIYDFAAGLAHFPYTIERGVRFPDEPIAHLALAHEPATVRDEGAGPASNDVPAAEREEGEAFPVAQGEPALSVLVAPLISGDEIRGRISLQNLDRTNAFSENDVRLLTTLAGSLSVALENARLVHETRQRNAELALINSVQAAVAAELDPQAIYEVVGEKIEEVYDAQAVSISTYDEAIRAARLPVPGRARRALRDRTDAGARVPEARAADRRAAARERGRRCGCRAVRQPDGDRRRGAEVGALRPARHGRASVRRHLAAERRSRARVHRVRPAAARHARRQYQRCARECSPRPGDPAAQRRARADQQRPGRDRRGARPAGDLRPRRRPAARRVRRAGRQHLRLRRDERDAHLPVRDRARGAAAGEPDPADRLPQARDGDAGAPDDRRDHAARWPSATATPTC